MKKRRAKRAEHAPEHPPFGAQVAFARAVTGLAWTALGALAGMISGAVTVVVWRQLDPFGWGLYEIVPGFVVAFICILLFNMLGPSPSWQMQSDFNAVNEDPESQS
jgi:Na+/proline symporter